MHQYCIGFPYGFGWAMKGFANDTKQQDAMSAYLTIEPWKSEPDTRSGYPAEALQGTLTATRLTVGATYTIYRWDNVESALTYSAEYKKASFTATSDKYVYVDDKSFMSDSATYYRVVQVAGVVEE